MHSGTIILGITGALAFAAAAVGCGTETPSGAGGGATASASASTTAGVGGGSTATATTGSGASTTASSTGTGAASCPFASAECDACLAQSCGITQCAGDMACISSYDTMRKGCACTAQLMMEKVAQNDCIDQFGQTPETMAQNTCAGASCQAVCYLP